MTTSERSMTGQKVRWFSTQSMNPAVLQSLRYQFVLFCFFRFQTVSVFLRSLSHHKGTGRPEYNFSFLKSLLKEVEESNQRELEVWMQANKAIRILVYGIVQGVNYRVYTKDEARKLGVVGTVRNLPNGCVEIFAEGPEEKLKELEKWCYKGSPASKVEKVESEWITPSGKFQTFKIIS